MPHAAQFDKLMRNVKLEYLGKPVPLKYQNRYGKKYDIKEMKPLAFAIAKSRKMRIDKD